MFDSQDEARQAIDRDNELHKQLRELSERLPLLTGAERQKVWNEREAVLDQLECRSDKMAERRKQRGA